MFIKKSKLRELEQKIEGLSDLLKIKWVVEDRYDSYCPPTIFYKQYTANQIDVLKALLDYLKLRIEIRKPKPAEPERIEITKIIK